MLVNAESYKTTKNVQCLYTVYMLTTTTEKHQYLPLEVLYEPRRPRERPGEAPLLSSPMSVTTPVLQAQSLLNCICLCIYCSLNRLMFVLYYKTVCNSTCKLNIPQDDLTSLLGILINVSMDPISGLVELRKYCLYYFIVNNTDEHISLTLQ